jgi:hypothetical protein
MQPGTKVGLGIIVACFGVGAALGITALLVHSSKPTSPDSQTSEAVKPDLQAQAGELWHAYEDNAIAADRKYRGKWVRVKGTVSRITSDTIGFGIIEAAGISRAAYSRLTPQEKKWFREGYPPNVVCKIDPRFREQFAEANRDKSFILVGRCTGSAEDPDAWKGMIVTLEDCRPVKE